MTLHYSFADEPDEEGALVLPYPADDREGRTNRGFLDLRARPELARKIAEAQPSRALQTVLVALAQPDSRFFTIGCDLGADQIAATKFAAGGYLQVASSDFGLTSRDRKFLVGLSAELNIHLEKAVGDFEWAVEFLLSVVETANIDGPGQLWSPVIHFSAQAETLDGACKSAEQLMFALGDLLAG